MRNLPTDVRRAGHLGILAVVIGIGLVLWGGWGLGDRGAEDNVFTRALTVEEIVYGVVTLAAVGVSVGVVFFTAALRSGARTFAFVRWTCVGVCLSVLAAAMLTSSVTPASEVPWHDVPAYACLWGGTVAAMAVALVQASQLRAHPARWAGVIAASPCAVNTAVLTSCFRGGTLASSLLRNGAIPLVASALLGVSVMLIWLAVEGISLSRDAGVWVARRLATTSRDVALFSLAKLFVLLGGTVVLARVGGLSPTVWWPGAAGLVFFACLGVLAVLLLSVERRIGLDEGVWRRAARDFAIVCAVALFAPGIVLAGAAGAIVVGDIGRLFGFVVVLLFAGFAAALSSRPRITSVILIAAPMAATAAHVAGHSPVFRGPAQTLVVLAERASTALSGVLPLMVPIIIGIFVVGLLVVAVRWAVQRSPAVVVPVALALWLAPTYAPPLSFAINAVAFDAMLTAVVLVVSITAWRRGWRLEATPGELVVLVVVIGAVAGGELVGAAAVRWTAGVLAPVLLVLPAVSQLTIDAEGLNERAHSHPEQVIYVIVTAAFSLIFVAAALFVLGAPGADTVQLGRAVVPYVIVPFAVILVAATSATRSL